MTSDLLSSPGSSQPFDWSSTPVASACRPSSRITQRSRRARRGGGGGGGGFTAMRLGENGTPEDYDRRVSDPTNESQQFLGMGGEGPGGGRSCGWIHGCAPRPLPAEPRVLMPTGNDLEGR